MEHREPELPLPKPDLETIIDRLEDARTSVEEIREHSLTQEENDARLDDVENTLMNVTDDLDEMTD